MALRRKVGPSYTTTQLGSQEWLRRLGLGRAWEGRGSEVAPRCPLSDSLTQYKQPSQLQTVLRCRCYTYCIITVVGRDVLVIPPHPIALHHPTLHRTSNPRLASNGSRPSSSFFTPSSCMATSSLTPSVRLSLSAERTQHELGYRSRKYAVLTRSQQVHLPLRIFGELLRVVAMDV